MLVKTVAWYFFGFSTWNTPNRVCPPSWFTRYPYIWYVDGSAVPYHSDHPVGVGAGLLNHP